MGSDDFPVAVIGGVVAAAVAHFLGSSEPVAWGLAAFMLWLL